MANNWFYRKNDQTHGPFSADVLQIMARAGVVSPDDLVWRDDMPEPVAARRVVGVFPNAVEKRLDD